MRTRERAAQREEAGFYCSGCNRYRARLISIAPIGLIAGDKNKYYRCDFCGHMWTEQFRKNQRTTLEIAPSSKPAPDPMVSDWGETYCRFCECEHPYDHRSYCPTRADENDMEQRATAALAFKAIADEHSGRQTRKETEVLLDRILMWQCERCLQMNGRFSDECGRCRQSRVTQRERGVAIVLVWGPGEPHFGYWRLSECKIPATLKLQVMITKAAAFCDGFYVAEMINQREQHLDERYYTRRTIPTYEAVRSRILDGDNFDEDVGSGDYTLACRVALEATRDRYRWLGFGR
jgi:hypothetical protein